MRSFPHQHTTDMVSPETSQRISSESPARSRSIHPASSFALRFQRMLLVILMVSSLVSIFLLMPGIAGAALKAVHPALPAVGEALSHYSQEGSGDLLPNSQSVIKNPKVDLIFEDVNSFWEQTFSDSQVNYGQTLTNMQVVEQYFTDVSGSAFEGILSQYSGISNTITLSKAVVLSMDPIFHSDQCGTNTISDSGTDGTGIAPDIWNAVSTQAPIDSSTIYFVFTPPEFHVYGPNDSCSQDNCGYHNDFLFGEGIYAVIPFGGGHCGPQTAFADPNGVQIDINTASHEQFEAITDPGAGQFGTSDGWKDSSGSEMSDKCENDHPGAYLNGHTYDDVQGEYDNATQDCVYPVAPPPTPTATSTPLPPAVVNVPNGGAFYTVWQNMGGATGTLGQPTDSWYTITGGQEQDFQYGRIYWSSSTGTHEVQGAILSEYLHLGGPTGGLNFPTSDEQNAYNSSSVAIGRENTFRGTGCTTNNQGSIILWSSSTGAHEIQGCIYQKYLALGGTKSFLGLPTSDEEVVGSGHASYFQGTNCGSSTGSAIFDEPGAGIHEIHGCIYQHYSTLIQLGVSLGYPTSDEQNVYNSSGAAIGRENTFSGTACGSSTGSAIIWSSNTGAYEVQGCIYQTYLNWGGTKSALGLPVSDEFGYQGGRESDFQGGYVDYDFSTNQTYVTLYWYGCGPVTSNC